MYYSTHASNAMPTANIAVNKSRLKVYKNVGPMPTYYLQKGQEFQIELFNPTSDVIMAKISLNNKVISQGGLVLNPGQRVFLDRYLDVAKKFLFDTYEVSNTQEVKKVIENNGDIKVEFYRERQQYNNPIWITNGNSYTTHLGNYTGTSPDYLLRGVTTSRGFSGGSTLTSGGVSTQGLNTSYYSNSLGDAGEVNCSAGDMSYTSSTDLSMDMLKDLSDAPERSILRKSSLKASLKSKSIETGRVEQGSESNQKFTYVSKSFDYLPFCTIEYKLLPVSQKVNTVDDIKGHKFCTNCGKTLGRKDNFCGHCGKAA